MKDKFSRQLNTLRLSVTDRCNLRCRYCMPLKGVAWLPPERVLHLEEMTRLTRLLAEEGVSRVKITGGEPLLRSGIVGLIQHLSKIKGVRDLSMTTNGLLLERYAAPLKRAGLQRLTVSLDSLNEFRFKEITRGGELAQVFRGLEAARQAGLAPLKINCVILKDNEEELLQIAALALEQPWDIRFIEYMPVTAGMPDPLRPLITPQSLKEKIQERWGILQPVNNHPSTPARVFQIPGGLGRIGFISSVSEPFCATCDRLRLGANGFLKLCMAQSNGINLFKALRAGVGDDELKKMIRTAVWDKPKGHNFYKQESAQGQMMSRMGG